MAEKQGAGHVRIPLNKEHLDQLRCVRESQLADWRAGRPQVVDELFVEEEVVRLMSGMGRACYLGLDGPCGPATSARGNCLGLWTTPRK